MSMTDEKIARINELYRKAKNEGLTEAEKEEQQVLRKEFITAFRNNLRGTLDTISIQEADGSITNLGEKYGNKGRFVEVWMDGDKDRRSAVQWYDF